jgi:hypothetical protein
MVEKNYESIIQKSAEQMLFLFTQIQANKSIDAQKSDSEFRNDFMKGASISDMEALKSSVVKSNDLIKTLRHENEYF